MRQVPVLAPGIVNGPGQYIDTLPSERHPDHVMALHGAGRGDA